MGKETVEQGVCIWCCQSSRQEEGALPALRPLKLTRQQWQPSCNLRVPQHSAHQPQMMLSTVYKQHLLHLGITFYVGFQCTTQLAAKSVVARPITLQGPGKEFKAGGSSARQQKRRRWLRRRRPRTCRPGRRQGRLLHWRWRPRGPLRSAPAAPVSCWRHHLGPRHHPSPTHPVLPTTDSFTPSSSPYKCARKQHAQELRASSEHQCTPELKNAVLPPSVFLASYQHTEQSRRWAILVPAQAEATALAAAALTNADDVAA